MEGGGASEGAFFQAEIWQSPDTVETCFVGDLVVSAVRLGGQGLCSCPCRMRGEGPQRLRGQGRAAGPSRSDAQRP